MGFKSGPVTLGTTDTTIFECPATFEGACVLGIANVGAASRTYTLKFYKASTDQTTVIANALSIPVNTTVKFPPPLSMEAGDVISGLCAESATDVVVTPTVTLTTSSAAKGLTPRGEYSPDTTYAKNDLVSVSGVGSFISRVDDNLNNDPTLSPSAWMVNAPKGDAGAAGTSGTAGLTIVRVASTGSTGPSGGGFAAGATIDGVTLAQNDLLLRASSTNPELNGVYVVPASGAASRHANFSTYDSYPGVVFSVVDGTDYGDTLWRCTSSKGGTIDVTAIAIEKIYPIAVRYDVAQSLTTDQKSQARANIGASSISAAAGMIDGIIVESHTSNAVTFAVKTPAGADPSSLSPVYFVFNDGAGGYAIRSVTSSLSLTISSGSTLGVGNNQSFRVWLLAFDNGGTVHLGAVNCRMNGGIRALSEAIPITTTAEGAAGGADSGGVVYTGAAIASPSYFRFIAHADYEGGLSSAGSWTASPTRIVLCVIGTKKPGEIVSSAYSEYGTAFTTTSSTYQSTGLSASLTLSSRCNKVRFQCAGGLNNADSGNTALARVYRGSTGIGPIMQSYVLTGSNLALPASSVGIDFPDTAGAITYEVKLASENNSSSVKWANGNRATSLLVEEVMN